MKGIAGLCIAASCTIVAGCYAEGHSYLLANGEIQRFPSMAQCENEAVSKQPGGGPRYAGFVCRRKVLSFTVDRRDYSDGKPMSSK